MNIAVFNVKFSNNVGDGIVAETTEFLLNSLARNSTIRTFDLGGRANYGSQGIKAPSLLKSMVNTSLNILPGGISRPLRRQLTDAFLKRDTLPGWRKELERTDRVVIGGGQLIADTELYFPIRLHALVSAARELKKPVYVHAVGVSNPEYWSPLGRKLFIDIFKDNQYLHYVSVRDELSRAHWVKIFGGDVAVVADPGNFTRETYSAAPGAAGVKGVMGIGVMAARVVTSHTASTEDSVVLSADDYRDLGERLLQKGFTPLYFTNGAPEDDHVLRQIQAQFSAPTNVIFAPRPTTPEDLVNIIARCEKIIAYRLHACIVATSLGLPAIGLAWDKKLYSYFESLDAAERVCLRYQPDALVEQLVNLQPLNVQFQKENYLRLVS